MPSSARLFNCARCRCQVVICSHCDRGNIYCGKRCSQTARRHSRRKASGRYQKTYRGRCAHAARQNRYRQRRRAKVTHQGSPPVLPDETLPTKPRTSARQGESPATVPGDGIRCDLCGRVCSHFLRQSFLRRRPTREAIDLPPPPGVRIEVASLWEDVCEDGGSPIWGCMPAGGPPRRSP